MKCEKLGYISDLLDYLNNNLYIAYLCGFDIFKPLPSYWTFERFIKDTSNSCLSKVMQGLVLNLKELGFIDNSFVSADATPIFANTKLNNPKSFAKNKFHKSNHPKSDKDCQLGVHTASNSHKEKNYDFYWGYKNHVLTDAIPGLPIAEVTTNADIKELSITVDFLKSTNDWFSLNEAYFIAEKGYDNKDINNFVMYFLKGHAFIPINPRGSKKDLILPSGNILCDAGLAMHKNGKQYFDDRIKQKSCCPFRTNKDDSLCPCMHPKYFNGKKNRGSTKYITLGTDYRSSIKRDSIFLKRFILLELNLKDTILDGRI